MIRPSGTSFYMNFTGGIRLRGPMATLIADARLPSSARAVTTGRRYSYVGVTTLVGRLITDARLACVARAATIGH